MAKTHTLLQVFVASPGDVEDERNLLAEVVTEFNKTWGTHKGVSLELLRWETDSRPGIGADAQDVINAQIGNDYDIFIGIMWGRFGSRTKRAESGTEEEFNRAYARLTDSPNSVQIMFYFKNAGIPLNKIDTTQLQKVQEFKKKISDDYGALYHSFESSEQFQTSVRMHLSTLVQDWLDANGTATPRVAQDHVGELPETSVSNPLANLMALNAETDEEGVIELVESVNEAMTEVTCIVERMSEATNALGEKFTRLADEVNQVAASGADVKAAKRLSNKAADDLEVFVRRMSVEIVEFNKQSARAMDMFGNIAMIAERDLNEAPDDIAGARATMKTYTSALSSAGDSLSGFRDMIFRLPRTTTALNRARKRTVAVMDDLLNQLRIAASQSLDVETLLARLEKT
jgi:archaellum component FlaC